MLEDPDQTIIFLRSIKESAFHVSQYPVLITITDNLPLDLQPKAAELITEAFGETLFYLLPRWFEELPSPEALKHRILLAIKPAQESFDSDTIPCEQTHLAPEYEEIITFEFRMLKGTDIQKSSDETSSHLSLSHQKLETTHGADLVRFSQRNLIRIYQSRHGSSTSFDPFIAWLYDARIIALGSETDQKMSRRMQAFFSANGACGYIKKPVLKIGPAGEIFDPLPNLPAKKILKVTMHMLDGWQKEFSLPYFSLPDFSAQVEVLGLPTDSTTKRTKLVKNQCPPVWNEEFKFSLSAPELTLLRIEVYEIRSAVQSVLCEACLPVSELRPGIYSVPLRSDKKEKLEHLQLLVGFNII